MKKKFILSAAALLVVVSLLCSCISTGRSPSPAAPPLVYNGGTNSQQSSTESSTTSSSSTNSTPTSSTESSTTSDISDPPDKPAEFDDPDTYIKYDPETGEYVLPPELKSLAAESMFAGDSVCRGYMAYGFISAKQSFASGDIGARNLLETDVFYRGKDRKFVSVLKEVNPKRLFLSMGMNDVNMVTAEEHYENLKTVTDTALKNSTANVYLCAITPIRVDFTEEGRIDEFNTQIRKLAFDYAKNGEKRVHFIDYTAPLTDENGKLLEKYDAGDGIHLGPDVYFIALHEIHKQINEQETNPQLGVLSLTEN